MQYPADERAGGPHGVSADLFGRAPVRTTASQPLRLVRSHSLFCFQRPASSRAAHQELDSLPVSPAAGRRPGSRTRPRRLERIIESEVCIFGGSGEEWVGHSDQVYRYTVQSHYFAEDGRAFL